MNKEALNMRNQDIMFVAMTPQKYYAYQQVDRSRSIQAIEKIQQLRKNIGKRKGQPTTDALIRMRDEQIAKWKKQ